MPEPAAVAAQRWSPIQPTSYRSHSGEYELRVDPVRPDGMGPASYELLRSGEVEWRRELEFTFQHAAVSDLGHAAGSAHTPSQSASGGYGDRLLVILSPLGEVLASDRIALTLISGPEWSLRLPSVRGMFVQEGLQRVVFRVDDLEGESRRTKRAWWTYDLRTGMRLSSSWREHPTGVRRGDFHEVQAEGIPGTNLSLVQWMGCDPPEGRSSCSEHGGLFTLLDPDLDELWRLHLPGDYTVVGNERASDALEHEMRDVGAILAVEPTGRFDLHFVAARQRVEFQVSPDASEATGWRVEEIGRAPYRIPPAPAVPVLGGLELERLPSVGLDDTRSEWSSPVRDVRAFAFDEGGSFRIVREHSRKDRFDFLHVDAAGNLLSEWTGYFSTQDASFSHWARLEKGYWLTLVRSPSHAGGLRVFRVAPDARSIVELPFLEARLVRALAAAPGGGWVCLAANFTGVGYAERVDSFDEDGGLRWSIAVAAGPEHGWARPIDLTSDELGRIAVLDGVRKRLTILGPDGERRESLDLEAAAGEPLYGLERVAADVDGGWAVVLREPAPRHLRFDRSGKLWASMRLRYPGSLTRGDLHRDLKIAPDGRSWTTDGHLLACLDASGRVEQHLGILPDCGKLDQPGRVAVSTGGRIYVQDRRTACVHAFDRDGRRRYHATPREAEIGLADGTRSAMAVSESGGVRIGHSYDSDSWFSFDADGALDTPLPFRPDPVAFTPDGSSLWHFKVGSLRLVASSGRVLREVARRPDNRFFQFYAVRDVAVATDGRLAVLDETDVALFGPGGEPLQVLRLPSTINAHRLAFAGRWVAVGDIRKPVLLIDLDTNALLGLPPHAFLGIDRVHGFGLSPEGRELWLVAGEPARLWPFRLP